MRQKIMERIGSEGCYFLSIVAAAERITGKRIDAVEVYEIAVAQGWMHEDCYMVNPALVLGHMTGQPWTVRHEHRTYRPKPGEVQILRYERQDTTKTWAHFVLANEQGQIEYDPYGDSRTVRDGYLVSSRIFWRMIGV